MQDPTPAGTNEPTDPAESTAAGTTRYSLRSMEKLITAAIDSVPGTAHIEARLAGLAGRAFPRLLVQIDPDRERVSVEASIGVVWPSPATAVAEQVRAAITEAIGAYTGYRTTRVNVHVGAAVPGERVAQTSVMARPHITPRQPSVRPTPVRSPRQPGARPLRPVMVNATPAPSYQVRAPQPPALRVPSAPAPTPLRPCGTAPSHKARPVAVPRPQPLRAITVTPLFGGPDELHR